MDPVTDSVAVVSIAFVALLLLLAWFQMMHYTVALPLRAVGRATGGLLDNIPVVGAAIGSATSRVANAIADGIDSVAGSVLSTVESWASSGVDAIVRLLHLLPRNNAALWEANAQAIEAVADETEHILRSSLPTVARQVVGNAGVLADQAQGRAMAYADSQIASAFQSMSLIVAGQIGGVDSQLSGLGRVISDSVLALEQQIAAEVTGIDSTVNAIGAAVAGQIGAEAARAEHAETAIAQGAFQEAQAAIATAEQLLGEAASALRGDYVARDAAIAATAAAATAAVAVEFETMMRECGNDLCNGLGGLSRLLPLLGEMLAGGAILGIVAEARRDPVGTAGIMRATVGGLVSEVHSFLESIS